MEWETKSYQKETHPVTRSAHFPLLRRNLIGNFDDTYHFTTCNQRDCCVSFYLWENLCTTERFLDIPAEGFVAR